MTTKFGAGIVFMKAQVCAKFHCPTSAVTLFSEDGGGGIHSAPVIETQKRPANSGGIIVHTYSCYEVEQCKSVGRCGDFCSL